MNMFSPLLRTSLLLVALSSAPLFCTSCGGSGSDSAAASTAALSIEDFMNGETYLSFGDSGVELRSKPTQAISTSQGAESRTVDGWLCIPGDKVYDCSITCTLEQAGAVLELNLNLSPTEAATVRTVFARLGIILSDNLTEDDIAELAATPIRYRVDTNGATATGITELPTTTGSVDDSAHRSTTRLEAIASF